MLNKKETIKELYYFHKITCFMNIKGETPLFMPSYLMNISKSKEVFYLKKNVLIGL